MKGRRGRGVRRRRRGSTRGTAWKVLAAAGALAVSAALVFAGASMHRAEASGQVVAVVGVVPADAVTAGVDLDTVTADALLRIGRARGSVALLDGSTTAVVDLTARRGNEVEQVASRVDPAIQAMVGKDVLPVLREARPDPAAPRSLLNAIAAAATAAGSYGAHEAYVIGNPLSATAPDMRTRGLLSTSPAREAAAVRATGVVPDVQALTVLHLVLLDTTGKQGPIPTQVKAWLAAFYRALLPNATISWLPPTPSTSPVPGPVVRFPKTRTPVVICRFASRFVSDTATLINRRAAMRQAVHCAAALDTTRTVKVTGRTSLTGTGPAAGIPLSLARANVIAHLLVAAGVPANTIQTLGLGATAPLPGNPRGARQRVVTVQQYEKEKNHA